MQEACNRAVKHPAPRYYITPKQAFQVISPMMKGNFIYVNAMSDNKRRMYHSLFKVVVDMSEKREYRDKSLWYIVQHAVNTPAPEFFLAGNTMYRIRLMIKKGYIQDDGRCVGLKSREKAYRKALALKKRRLELRAAAGL